MVTIHIWAANLERLEAMLYATDSAKARYGEPEKLLEHLLNENVLERAQASADYDAEAGEAALRDLVCGPRPEAPLSQLHALVFQGIVETLCADLGDAAFSAMTLVALEEFATKHRPILGEALLESVKGRAVPFLNFSDDVQSPRFSYWLHDEIKQLLARVPKALEKSGGDAETGEMLHRLREAWTNLLGQGPDGLLIFTL